MYNIFGFGNRISKYRKMMNMTQEELAEKLNITAQAISKWENENSFPEITIIPMLAKELNVTIEDLFGNEKQKTEQGENLVFPEEIDNGIPLVHIYREAACYSKKEIQEKNNSTVIFKDGSSADLSSLYVINKGKDDILFRTANDNYSNHDSTKKDLKVNFSNIESLNLEITNAKYYIKKSDTDKTHVEATGSTTFIDALDIIKDNKTLCIKTKNDKSKGNNNRISIYFGNNTGKDITAKVIGSGSLKNELNFEKGYVKISGSGNISTEYIEQIDGKIAGSGSIKCSKIDNADFKISGSGNINIDEVISSIKVVISGSGNINIGESKIEYFESRISGSGNINAKELETRKAKIEINGSGNTVVGRVIEESIEKHCKNSRIKVLKRG